MKVLLLRDTEGKPFTVTVRGVFRKRYYQIFSDNGVIELPIIRAKDVK